MYECKHKVESYGKTWWEGRGQWICPNNSFQTCAKFSKYFTVSEKSLLSCVMIPIDVPISYKLSHHVCNQAQVPRPKVVCRQRMRLYRKMLVASCRQSDATIREKTPAHKTDLRASYETDTSSYLMNN